MTAHDDSRASGAGALHRLDLPADVLLIGVLVCVASLPVVTALAAAGAGAVLLRERVEDERTPSVRRFLAVLAAAVRQPSALLAPVVVLAVVGLDVLALAAGPPGAGVMGPLVAAALALVVLAALRGAARWRPGLPWRQALGEAAAGLPRDWRGTLLLAGALVVVAVIALQVPGFIPVLPGLLTMAAVAVERRATGAGDRPAAARRG
ncbi:hypothetical protein [Streptomyces thermodiastaticus]|uniref:hypothetical protein n=1 Tax=Streptomyces thermodiastaticus TaxID=44061 RepID=UPI00167BCDEE|nr:hypothetical protein [Streptomyces thermodiastaticus]MCE7551071.1 hypothetical protein [Streptomyces thermodiastaticus]GHF58407.1 hypothetical protein GCM10018787_03300 [Streptomyces thermodiastaticus]